MINEIMVAIAAVILGVEIYFFIGLIFGIVALLENWRWARLLFRLDMLRDFIVKWPIIIYYGMNNYFKERKEKMAIKKEKIHIIAFESDSKQ